MAATLPPFSLSAGYFLYILAVTIGSIFMLVIGGWIKERLMSRGLRFRFAHKSRIRKHLFGFLLFIVAIFLLGWMSERLQATLYSYLMQNAASSITGIILSVVFAFVMYEIFIWGKYNKNDGD